MKKVTLIINGQAVEAEEGVSLLWAALDNGIYIPHLCAIREAGEPAASCRLCFVEIHGYPQPVTACTEQVRDGMVVKTRSPRVDRLLKTAFELLLSAHRLDCANCAKNRVCSLQQIARERKLKLKGERLKNFERNLPVDDSHPDFTYDPNKCVLCGRCVWACRERARSGVLGFAYRGFTRRVTTFDNTPFAQANCAGCNECVNFCPVGALSFKKAPQTG